MRFWGVFDAADSGHPPPPPRSKSLVEQTPWLSFLIIALVSWNETW